MNSSLYQRQKMVFLGFLLLLTLPLARSQEPDSFLAKSAYSESLGGNEKKALYFDSSPKNCQQDNCLADENHIEFYQLFKFDDRDTNRDYSCQNIFLETPMVPDISYNHILKPSVVTKFESKSQSFDPAKIHSVSYRRYSGISAILSSGDYMFYGKPKTKDFGP
jgi:hypothetical protein